MTKTQELLISLAIVAGLSIFAIGLTFIYPAFFGAGTAFANPSKLQQPVTCSTQGSSATALATTSPSYMRWGTGTSTATCNMANAGDGTEVFDTAVIAINFSASSTRSNLIGGIEQSMDGVEWYPITAPQAATTTENFSLNPTGQLNWFYASSTVGGSGVAATTGTSTRAVKIPVDMKYVRVWFGLASTTGNGGSNASGINSGAVWASIIGKTERGY
jgi:hypothetical protein